MSAKKKTFEEQMTRLEEIVVQLEQGDVPLEQSLALYAEGSKLIASCNVLLDQAEQQVIKLQQSSDGMPQEVPFSEHEDEK